MRRICPTLKLACSTTTVPLFQIILYFIYLWAWTALTLSENEDNFDDYREKPGRQAAAFIGIILLVYFILLEVGDLQTVSRPLSRPYPAWGKARHPLLFSHPLMVITAQFREIVKLYRSHEQWRRSQVDLLKKELEHLNPQWQDFA
jgi:hypothetical protein